VTTYVTKASGEREKFSTKKFQRSLRKAGADPRLIKELTEQVLTSSQLKSTKDIYNFAYQTLRKKQPPIAARYNLRESLLQLGPSGFPFEKFVAEIYKRQGYETKVDQTLQGLCVDHEIDVVLKKDNQRIMIECKFHHPHIKADIKIPLYIKARFDDVVRNQKRTDTHHHQSWIVTNTKFTTKAEQFAECTGIKLISWSYPLSGNLAELIEDSQLQPITMLTSLSGTQKRSLIGQGVLMCQDLESQKESMRRAGLTESKINKVLNEADIACKMGYIE
jgi:hypothetical protein